MKLNEKRIIHLRNLRRKNHLYEKNEEKKIETIEIASYEDIIDTIHYMLNILQKDLMIEQVVDTVMNFDQIYNAAKKDSKN